MKIATPPSANKPETTRRSIWYQFHFWIGWIAAIPIALVCLTGAILTFQKEITQWEHKNLFQLNVTGPQPPLDHVLAAYAQEGYQVNHLSMPQNPQHAYQAYCVQIRPEGRLNAQVAYDPYADRLIKKADTFSVVQTTTEIHRHLLGSAPGQMIVAVSSVLLAVTATFGLILWWPMRDRTFARAWKRGRAIDWHNALGLAALLPLFVMAVTGITFTWGQGMFPVLEKIQGGPSRQTPPAVSAPVDAAKIPLQAVAKRVGEAFPDIPITGIQPSNAKSRPHVFFLDAKGSHLRVFMHPYTGDEITRTDGSGGGPVGWYRNNFGKLHTFGPYGFIPRLIWALFSLLGTVLVVTGLWISIKRWQRRKRAAV